MPTCILVIFGELIGMKNFSGIYANYNASLRPIWQFAIENHI